MLYRSQYQLHDLHHRDRVITAVKGGTPAGGGIKDATFSHGLILKARKHAEADFNKNTTRFGLECYKDANNDLSLYISETGSIAASVKAAAAAVAGEGRQVRLRPGLESPQVRRDRLRKVHQIRRRILQRRKQRQRHPNHRTRRHRRPRQRLRDADGQESPTPTSSTAWSSRPASTTRRISTPRPASTAWNATKTATASSAIYITEAGNVAVIR